MQQEKGRYYLVDGIRGIAIVNMVIFHFMYDVCIVYGKDPGWYDRPATRIWQQMICWTFILVSGFVWAYGKEKNLRRGIVINALGCLITVATLVAMPSQAIWFGILNFIGCAILLTLLLEKPASKVPPIMGLAVCFLLFLLCREIEYGLIGIPGLFQIKLPGILYTTKILTPLGFPYAGFVSGDYFPMLPWMFLYLCGFYFNRIFAEQTAWHKFARCKLPCLSALGTKSIWIYMLHQPIIMLICVLIFR